MFLKKYDAFIAGLALFSMFFGAGDLIWPIILGGASGNQNFYAMLGLLITGVSLPLLGLIAMLLFQGDYKGFFCRLGKYPAFLIILSIQVILGPLGSIPRLLTLCYATLKPYLPHDQSLLSFSICASFFIAVFAIRPRKVIDLLGLILSPLLILCLFVIIIVGYMNAPEMQSVILSSSNAFTDGLLVGYNTLDLIASFIFAPMVLAHFTDKDGADDLRSRKTIFKKVFKASICAALMLSTMYICLTYLAAYYTPYLDPEHKPEERLSAISLLLLGKYGGFISCGAVAIACLTTAIPLSSIFANYIRSDLFGNRGGTILPLFLTLFISVLIANMGFMGIAKMLSPILQILCPGLIVLSILNIFHKLYETPVPKIPVYVSFAFASIGYVF